MVSKQECRAKGGILRNDGVCQIAEYKGGETRPLKAGGFADVGIVPLIDDLNAKGCSTVASCSGLLRDHFGHEEGAYLSVEMPDYVVQGGFGGSAFDVDPEDIKKPEVVKCFLNAGKRANWVSELSKYMTFVPTAHFKLPVTKSVKTDKLAEAQPEVVVAQRRLDELMREPHSNEEFLRALDERDAIRNKAYDRFGRKQWTDEETLRVWHSLQTEVGKCCGLLKE